MGQSSIGLDLIGVMVGLMVIFEAKNMFMRVMVLKVEKPRETSQVKK